MPALNPSSFLEPVDPSSFLEPVDDPSRLTRPRRVEDEREFKNWYAPIASQHGLDPDPDNPEHHYNYRAAHAAGAMPDSSGHWPSQFKTLSHPNRFVDDGGETIDSITGEPARKLQRPRRVDPADFLEPATPALPVPALTVPPPVKPLTESVTSQVNMDADFSDEQSAPELPAQVKAFVPIKFPLPSDRRERESMTPEQLMRRAIFEHGDREGIPAAYVEQFVAREKASGGLKPAPYRLDDPRRAITTAELLNSADYDAQGNSLTLHVEPALLDRLKESYHTEGKGYTQRILDDARDPNKKPGEVFYDVVASPAAVVAKGAELASRPLQAASTGLNAVTRAQASPLLRLAGVDSRGPAEILKGAPGAVWDELTTGETRPGYENPAGEVVDKLAGPTLDKVNPNLRPLAKHIADMVGDPLMIAGGASMIGKAGKVARAGSALNLAEDATTIDRRMAAIASRVEYAYGVRPTLSRLPDGGISVEAVVDGEPLRMTIPPGGFPSTAPVIEPASRAARALSASPRQVGDAALDLWNATRSIKTSFDLSAPRNSLILTLTRPVHAAKAFAKQIQALRSEDAAANLMRVIDRDAVRPIADRAGLQITRLDGSMAEREEVFRSAIAEKIPGVRASERAFHTYLNQLRFSTFKDYAVSHPAASAEDLKGVARAINYFTGRGSFGPLENKRVVQGLSAAFYAPRLSVSYVQSLASPLMGTAAAKKFAARHVAQFVATGLAVGGLVKATRKQTGIDFQGDPRSSDFGHIIVGRQRVNLFGGFSALARYTAQALTGERKTESGEIRAASRTDTLKNYGRTRLHPSIGFIIDLKTGKTLDGRELYDAQGKLKKGEALRAGLMPMSAGDITDAVRESGLKGALLAPLALSGADVQTRQPPKPATEPQKKYLRGLVSRGGHLPPQLTGKRVDDLTLDEASKMIEELKQRRPRQR